MSLEATHLHSQLWVVAVLNNPMRYKRRVELFHQFIARMKVTGVNLCVVELAYGDRAFAVSYTHLTLPTKRIV